MDIERFELAARIFLEVSDLEPAERERVLASACGDDAELRGEVELLLAGDARALDLDRSPIERHAAQLATWSEAEHTQVVGYRLGRVLGRGGMGIVFEAEQEHPARRVALKLINPLALSDEALRRFEHEVEVLARLDDPGVARILDAGSTSEGRPYFTMELVDGSPLTDHARTNSLSFEERLALLAEVCDTVAHAHQLGIVHRDLKPANILVQRDGRSRILDFGIARVMSEDSACATMLTATGQLLGTIAYMSPEQAAGESVDGRSDVYSLGVLLYELIAGHLPYEVAGRPLHDAVRIVREEDPTKLRGHDTRVAREVETIVRKAMEKEPARRYARAADLAADLRRFLANEPILARPASRIYVMVKFARRHRAMVGGSLVALVALVAGTVVSLIAAADAIEAHKETVVQLELLHRETYRARLTGAQALKNSGEAERARAVLASVPAEDRGWEFRHLEASLDRSSLMVLLSGERVLDALVTADGRLLTVTGEGFLRVHDAGTGELLSEQLLHPSGFSLASLTRSGERLAAYLADEQRVRLWAIDSSEVLAEHECSIESPFELLWQRNDSLVTVMDGYGTTWAWSPGHDPEMFEGHKESHFNPIVRALPDGAWLVGSHDTHTCDGAPSLEFDHWRVAGASGSPVFHRGQDLQDLATSRDGTRAVGGGVERVLEVMDLRTGEVERHGGPRQAIGHVDLTQDGGAAAAAAGSNVYVFDLEGAAPVEILSGHGAPVSGVRFSSEGAELVSWDTAGEVRLWERGPNTNGMLLEGHGSYVYDVAYVADGARLVSVAWDGSVRLWSSADGVPLGIVGDGLGRLKDVMLIDAGSRAYAASDIELFVCDLEGGSAPRPVVLEAQSSNTQGVAISPDGSRLVISGYEGAELVETGTWRSVAKFERTVSAPIRFSPDGTLLAIGILSNEGTGFSVALHDGWTGAPRGRHACDSRPVCLAFSPAGDELAVGGLAGEILVISMASGERRLQLSGHVAHVLAVVYSPDGTRLATGGNDNTVRIWDAATGDPLLVWTPPASSRRTSAFTSNYVKALAFSPDGAQLASASGDGSLYLWNTRPQHEVWAARERFARERERARPRVEALFDEFGEADLVREQLAREDFTPEEREAHAQVAIQIAIARRGVREDERD